MGTQGFLKAARLALNMALRSSSCTTPEKSTSLEPRALRNYCSHCWPPIVILQCSFDLPTIDECMNDTVLPVFAIELHYFFSLETKNSRMALVISKMLGLSPEQGTGDGASIYRGPQGAQLRSRAYEYGHVERDPIGGSVRGGRAKREAH